MTHGSKNHRLPGSIGAGSTPGRVYPGKKMAGHLGNTTVTLKNTKVLYVNPEENIIVVKGSVPGKKNTVLKIQSQKKV
jgi:large subunit ribosomal protein L3